VAESLSTFNSEAQDIRAIERARLQALLKADIETAEPIHADDFQVISPLGAAFSKEQYLGAVAAGVLNYVVMELDSAIDVRMYDDVALIRYRAQIEIDVQGQRYPRAGYWFTDAYEKRKGRWQIVWSQGTGITI
jgi:ketosteroid isomerase-like protein